MSMDEQFPATVSICHKCGVSTEYQGRHQCAERLPNDAYAAQGGKAAVNELLTMKMNQVLKLNDKLNDIADELDRLYADLFNYGQEVFEGLKMRPSRTKILQWAQHVEDIRKIKDRIDN